MKKILLTGSSGLVGSAVRELDTNYKWVHLDSSVCNLLDYTRVIAFFNSEKPDIIIHLASRVGGLFKNMSDKVQMFEENVLINTNVIRAAHESGVKELVACLSTCVFPDGIDTPLTESTLHNGPPHDSNEGYAYAKRMMEVHCRLYTENFPDRRYICVIPTNVYGHHDNFHLEDSHVIPALIHRCYLAKQNKVPFEVRGTGKPLRQFIYSKDLAVLILKVLESDTRENVILCDLKEYSIRSVAEMISDYIGTEIIFNHEYSDGQYSKTADNSRLQSLVQFKFTELNHGIKETIDWFIDNYNTLRK